MSQSPNEIADEQTESVELAASDRHRLLMADRRRVALDIFREWSAPVGLRELAKTIANRETQTDTVTDELVKEVAITLHHNHLPKLADYGIIDYDPDAKRITVIRKHLESLTA